jgi:hypothetical protein
VARTFLRESPVRAVAVADAAFPANQPTAPTGDYYTETAPLPAGIFRTEGAMSILVDVVQGGTSTANTYNVLAWNRTANRWVSVLIINVASGVQALRTSVPNWASDYAFVVVAGATVSASIYVLTAQNITA